MDNLDQTQARQLDDEATQVGNRPTTLDICDGQPDWTIVGGRSDRQITRDSRQPLPDYETS